MGIEFKLFNLKIIMNHVAITALSEFNLFNEMANTPYIQNMVATAVDPTKWNVFAEDVAAEGVKADANAPKKPLTGDAKAAE